MFPADQRKNVNRSTQDGDDDDEYLTKLTLYDFEIRRGHDEDHSALFRLPPVIRALVHDGEDVAFDEGELVGITGASV